MQFLPLALIPLMVWLYPGKGLKIGWFWAAFGAYALAKIAEQFDAAIYDALGKLNGHTLKHVLAALAILFVILAIPKQSAAEHAVRPGRAFGVSGAE